MATTGRTDLLVMAAYATRFYLSRTHQPKHSSEMWRLWIEEVMARANPFDDPTVGVTAKVKA